MADGFVALLVRSYAPGATEANLNLVLWKWEDGLSVVDDENRLGRI
jgi:hypothetical protein